MRKYRRPYKIRKKKSIFRNRFFWLGISILIILSGIFYFIFFHSFFQVKVIEISGNQKVTKESLESLLNEKINQKILFFPSQSIFLANFSEVKKEILENFPQVKEAGLKRKFPNTILVQIKEREPAAVFCRIHLETERPNCFFIDKEGIIFEPNVTRQDLVTLKKGVVGEISLGEKIIKEEQISKILGVEEKLKNELKILSEEILVISEESFNIKTSEGWQIYFNFQEDLGWQLTKLGVVLEKEIPLERRKNLEYVDVRFGNFAPYKYRD